MLANVGAPAVAQPFTNRLIHSADPYLLLHAHNPVDWYPWGPEAFAKAKAENKPIFLSIGYSTCYWCHVAEKEIYSNPTIAALMNKWFVNVKVDREERPDVDRFYIIASEMLTGHAAWPNNLFLTPSGEPFYAGSYFPPKDDGGQQGFPTVLAAIHDLWVNHRAEEVEPAAKRVMDAFRALEAKQAAASTGTITPRAWLKAAAATLLASFDAIDGGFGSAKSGPKFPQAPALDLLAVDSRLEGNREAADALGRTLDAMAFGGIDDQLGGGFFRYSTDPTWSVPHFEKPLSDNAQLLLRYVGRYARTKVPLYRDVAAATARYIVRDMSVAGGGFATAQDASTNGVEGATYLWTRAQIEAVLGTEAAKRFLSTYELTPFPDESGSPDSAGVLRLRVPIADTVSRFGVADPAAVLALFAPERAKLLAARDARPQPPRDDKVVTSLNGLAIGALARAGRILGDASFTGAAEAAAARIWSLAYNVKTDTLSHQIFEGKPVLEGTLDDYATFGGGLLTLAETTGEPSWRERAVTLGDAILARFIRPDGRFAAGTGDGLLPIRLDDGEDADAPSGTSSALSLLLRLGAAPEGQRFADAAATIAAHLAPQIDARTSSWPSAVVALAEHPPSPVDRVAGGTVPATASSANALAVPDTAAHLHASARFVGGADPAVTIALRIDPGYHINSDTPSLDYLMPTTVRLAEAKARIVYPPARHFQPTFAKSPLSVYEGDVTITARLAPGSAKPNHVTVSAQACDDRTCLPPADLVVPVVQDATPAQAP